MLAIAIEMFALQARSQWRAIGGGAPPPEIFENLGRAVTIFSSRGTKHYTQERGKHEKLGNVLKKPEIFCIASIAAHFRFRKNTQVTFRLLGS